MISFFSFFLLTHHLYPADSDDYSLGTELIHNTNKESKFRQMSPGVVTLSTSGVVAMEIGVKGRATGRSHFTSFVRKLWQ